jgi:hypothetical protein
MLRMMDGPDPEVRAMTIGAGRMDGATRPSGMQLGRDSAALAGWGRPVDRCSPFWMAAGGVVSGASAYPWRCGLCTRKPVVTSALRTIMYATDLGTGWEWRAALLARVDARAGARASTGGVAELRATAPRGGVAVSPAHPKGYRAREAGGRSRGTIGYRWWRWKNSNTIYINSSALHVAGEILGINPWRAGAGSVPSRLRPRFGRRGRRFGDRPASAVRPGPRVPPW